MILSKLGYSNVLLAANGQECLDLIERVEDEPSDDVGRRGPVETILMDASMDIMDGLECSRRIRARQRPDRPRPFIIAQTANVSKEFQAKCLEAGMVTNTHTRAHSYGLVTFVITILISFSSSHRQSLLLVGLLLFYLVMVRMLSSRSQLILTYSHPHY